MRSEELIIHSADFHSMKMLISFRNTSTGSEKLGPAQCTLVEWGNRALVLELPPSSCSSNHNVVLDISVAENGKAARELLSATGKIVQWEKVGSQSKQGEKTALRVTVSCVQFDEKSWQELIQLYSSRQESITCFLKAARGF
jgi:hypothetical protein